MIYECEPLDSSRIRLEPIRLHRSGGFNRAEILRIPCIVEENNDAVLGARDARKP
jgi:hypothetical protein